MPREFFKYMKPKLERRWSVLRLHVIPFVLIVSTILGFYYASRYIAPGWITYFASSVTLALVGLTALARVNDIEHEKTAFRWQLRRLGLVLVGTACLGLIIAPWFSTFKNGPDWPSWREVMFRMGVLFTWVTTPMMPPWHRYMSGEYRKLVVEVPTNVEVEVVRSDTVAGGGMYEGSERRRTQDTEHGP